MVEMPPSPHLSPPLGHTRRRVPPDRAGFGDEASSLARFEVFRDRAGEWRWGLVHRNGNAIATSGEGYTARHNAEKGLRSVVANAPDAEVEDGG